MIWRESFLIDTNKEEKWRAENTSNDLKYSHTKKTVVSVPREPTSYKLLPKNSYSDSS
jgi:hypothetical protein